MMNGDGVPLRRLGAIALLAMWGLIGGVASPLAVAPASAAQAVPPSEDPANLGRIKSLESELRCLVCQAQSIAESDSEFSQDIRREINRMIDEGRSDREIKEFLVERYGDFILYRPPLQSTTVLLWAGPGILLLVGFGSLVMVLRRRRRGSEESDRPFTAEERRRAQALLATTADGKGKTT